MKIVHNYWLLFCLFICVMRLWHIPELFCVCTVLLDLLSRVYIKQVHSAAAAGKFSLLSNRPTHNSSIFFYCVRYQHWGEEKGRKAVDGQANHCGKREHFSTGTFFQSVLDHRSFEVTPTSSLLLCFNTVVNDITPLSPDTSWHYLWLRGCPARTPHFANGSWTIGPAAWLHRTQAELSKEAQPRNAASRISYVLRCSNGGCIFPPVY